MAPPEGPETGRDAAGTCPPAVPFRVSTGQKLTVLTQRADFLRAARARHTKTRGVIVQGRARTPGEADGIRVGYTCSKKVGNAVARNRAKRRLREVARAILAQEGRPGWDYVLIGRASVTAERPFEALKSDLSAALRKVHAEPSA